MGNGEGRKREGLKGTRGKKEEKERYMREDENKKYKWIRKIDEEIKGKEN